MKEFLTSAMDSGDHTLLVVGATLFSIVSAWTTQVGMSLILEEGGVFLQYVAPWMVAIALSLFLLSFTFRLISDESKMQRGLHIAGYLVVATVSIFFNFNAIYSAMAADDIEIARASELELKIREAIESGRFEVRAMLSAIDLDLAEAKVDMEYEAVRVDRPGEGHRYVEKRQKYLNLREQAAVARKPYKETMAKLDELITRLDDLEGSVDYHTARKRLSELDRLGKQVLQLLTPYKSTAEYKELADEIGSSEDAIAPEHSLQTISDQVMRVLREGGGGPDFFRFVIAVIIAAIIDLAVFFAVLLSVPVSGMVISADKTQQKEGYGVAPPREFPWKRKGEA